MRDIIFKGYTFDDFNEWSRTDKMLFRKLVKLIEETRRDPYRGSGNPEPLKYQLSGCWSRRINDEHRLVYFVTEHAIEIVSCKYHYNE